MSTAHLGLPYFHCGGGAANKTAVLLWETVKGQIWGRPCRNRWAISGAYRENTNRAPSPRGQWPTL